MSVEVERQRLYGLPLAEFTAERNRAARELRAEGRREDAAAVAGLPKPTLAAWAINMISRTRRREVDLLLDSGNRLYDAQRANLESGERANLDRARRSFDEATVEATSSAREVLGERATQATLERIAETLRSAALTPEGRELLATGLLTKELSSTGLGADRRSGAGGAHGPPRLGRKDERSHATAARRPESRAGDREQLAQARSSLQRANDLRDQARKRLIRADDELVRATEKLTQARDAHRQTKKELAAAEAAVSRAEAALRKAESGKRSSGE